MNIIIIQAKFAVGKMDVIDSTNTKEGSQLHIAMYPWFALGHLTSFLQLANKLAETGHKISFFLPPKTQTKLSPLNHHPHLISFIPIPIPVVPGLSAWAETAADVPYEDRTLIMAAMDLTRDTIECHLSQLKPDLIFFDFADWIPGLARQHGIKSLYYSTMFLVSSAYLLPRARALPGGEDLTRPPPGFPPSKQMITLRAHEARAVGHDVAETKFGGPECKSILERHTIGLETCDGFAAKACREMDGTYCEFIQKMYGKPLLLAGPVVHVPPRGRLEDRLEKWLSSFSVGSVVYCALGSEWILMENRFQELLLGLEATGMPFLAALKPPTGHNTIESALPEGFKEKTKGRGVVDGGWVQQQLILKHPSIGCFVTHCGAGSLSEAMVSKCQIVLFPQETDQFMNARMMSLDFKVGVEVEIVEDDGSFSKEDVCKAIKVVMDDESIVGLEVMTNHTKLRDFLLTQGLEHSYISQFVHNLRALLSN